MDCPAPQDLIFVSDEKMDFDVSWSPGSSLGDEEDDDVFKGSSSEKEQCVSAKLDSRFDGALDSLSSLTGDQMDALFQEAHKLAVQLQNCQSNIVDGAEQEKPRQMSDSTSEREEFIQDVENKLSMLSQPASVCSPMKRQTFVVQDSPMKELPPIFQQRRLRGSSSTVTPASRLSKASRLAPSTGSSTRPAPSTRLSTRLSTSSSPASSTRPAASTRLSTRLSAASRLGPSSPASTVKPKPVQALRGKAMTSVGVVLPNKPAAVSAANKKVERAKLLPASKLAPCWNKSPGSRSSSRAASSEDLLSDSVSVASDASDSSLNSSLLGKHSLAPPTKGAVNRRSVVKAPPPQTRQMTERRKTSSSSSSVSSFNSSISLSPAPGKATTSAARRVSSAAGPAPNKPAAQNRPRRSIISTVSEASAAARRPSGILRKTSEPEPGKAGRSTPLKRTEVSSLQPPSARKVLEASIPASVRANPGLAKSKPQALVPPTLSGIRRAVGSVEGLSPDSSQLLKRKQLVLASNKQILPQKSVSVSTPPAGGCRSLQLKARRPSALPTPLRRGLSAIPFATPTNQTRIKRPLADSDPSPARGSVCSPAPADCQESVDVPMIKPFCLEDDPPVTPPSVQEPEQPESTDTEAPGDRSPEPCRNLMELEAQEEGQSRQKEVLLLDLPAPVPQPQEKLLIDLTNTPDLIRTSIKPDTAPQLIDLSSPLIKWSPEDKRENNAPLINLSF
ncbi:uncharacterized protein ACB057_005487 [Neosynchiropus ocellatus]